MVAKTYAAALPKLQTLQFDPLILQKVLFGVTSYMWECSKCGTTQKEELLGSDENQLTEVLEKANRLGMQYVDHNGESYGVAKVPKDIPTQKIPISTFPPQIPNIPSVNL